MLPLTIIVSPCKASFQAFLINGIALSLSYLAFMAILGKCIMGLLWRRIPSATSHNREQLLSGLEIKKYKYVCQNITKTRIAERRFLTGLPRGYFFWGEGEAIHTQATTKPCRRPLRETESHVRLKHKLIQNIVPFWKTFVTKKMSTIFNWGAV